MKNRERVVRADTPEGQLAGEVILEVVHNQLRDNNPPETALTLARLMKNGESEVDALRLIGCVVANEVFAVLNSNAPFDEARYVANLRRLPELPFDESDGE